MSYFISRTDFLTLPAVCSIPVYHRDLIILDIVKIKPTGPVGGLCQYADVSSYRPTHLHEYDPVALFRMGIRDKDTLKEEVRRLKFENKSDDALRACNRLGIMTKCINRAWPMIRSAVLGVKSVGSAGVYEVYNYDLGLISTGVLGYVYAQSPETASIIGRAMCGFMTEKSAVRVRYIEWEDQDYADMLNTRFIAALSDSRNKLAEKQEKMQKQLETLEVHLGTLTNIINTPDE